jgi:hypothetical protein
VSRWLREPWLTSAKRDALAHAVLRVDCWCNGRLDVRLLAEWMSISPCYLRPIKRSISTDCSSSSSTRIDRLMSIASRRTWVSVCRSSDR